MATSGNDFIPLQATDPSIVAGGAGNDTYILSAALLAGRTTPFTISDTSGANSIQLVPGLQIVSSTVAADSMQLIITDGTTNYTVNINGASTFTYEAGGNAVAGINGTDVNYSTFVTNTLGTTVPTGTGTSTGGAVTVGGGTTTPTTPTISLTSTAVSLAEGNSGTTNMTFTVNLSAAQTSAVTVNYATANGTATAGSDYTAATGTLTFAAGETSKTITVPIIGDTVVEPNETFTVTLSSPSTGVTLGTASVATGTITNDDANAAPTVTASPTSFGAQVAQTVAMNVDFTVADADTGVLTVTITPANGQVNLPNIAGVTDAGQVTLGTGQVLGSNYPSLTVTGTIANLNAALDKLNYQTGLTAAGTDTITISVTDNVAGTTPVTTTLTANVGSQLTDLTAGADTRTGSAGDDLLRGTQATLTGNDVIDLGLGSSDTLQLTLGGNINIGPGGTAVMATPIKGTEKVVFIDANTVSGRSSTIDGDHFNGELSTVQYQLTDTTGAHAVAVTANDYTNLKQGATVILENTNSTNSETSIGFTALTVGIKNAALAGSNSDTATVKFVGAAVTGATNDNTFSVGTLNTQNIETTTLHTGSTALDRGFTVFDWQGTSTGVLQGANALEIGTLNAGAGTGTLNTINGSQLTGSLVVGNNNNNIAVALTGGSGADRLLGANGDDNLTGNAGNDLLYGGAGSNVISGGDGNDILIALQAAPTAATTDVLTGGLGTDTFFVNRLTDLTSASTMVVDTIADFDFAADKISGLAANVTSFKPTQAIASTATTLLAAATAALGDTAGQIGAGQAGTFTWNGDTYLLINTATAGLQDTDTLIKVNGATNIPTTAGGSATTAFTNDGFNLVGSVGNDALLGSQGADTITGGTGNDTIDVGAADAVIDRVVFGTAAANGTDTITNFLQGAASDVLVFTTHLGAAPAAMNAVITANPAASTAAADDVSLLVDIADNQDITTAAGLQTAVAAGGEYANIDMAANETGVIITAADKNAGTAQNVFFATSDGAGDITVVLVGTLTGAAMDIDSWNEANFA